MQRLDHRVWTLLVAIGGLALLCGCHEEGGVTDIVLGSLRLAFGIVELAS